MKKLLFFILGFMLMALSACQPAQNKPEEDMPDGILSIQFCYFARRDVIKWIKDGKMINFSLIFGGDTNAGK